MSIQEILEAHIPTTANGTSNQDGGSAHRYCKCGLQMVIKYESMDDGDVESNLYLDSLFATHMAEVLEQHIQEREMQMRLLIRDMVDPDPCWFDHHGGCQAHGYLSLNPGELCPQMEAKQLLEEADTTSEKDQ